MRGHRNRGSLIGCISIAAGLAVILSLLLPTGFWWFLFGTGLVAAGIWMNKCC